MNTGEKFNLSSFGVISLVSIMMFLAVTSCGGSSGGGDSNGNQQNNVSTKTVAAALGDNFKNISLTAGVQKEVKFTYTLPSSITSYESFSVNLAETMQYVTVSSSPIAKKFNVFDMLKTFAGLTEAMAASTAQVTAYISYAGDPNVCSSSFRFGPYNMTGDIGVKPSSETSSAASSAASVNITNSGTFEICVVIVPPIDAFVTVSDVAVDLKTCDQAPADILGTWTGTYSCTNFGVGNEEGTVTLTISKNADGSYHYEDGTAIYDGHLCGKVFKFNGGVSGNYTESGTFVLNDDGTASKTSKWNSVTPGFSGGDCTDSLHR